MIRQEMMIDYIGWLTRGVRFRIYFDIILEGLLDRLYSTIDWLYSTTDDTTLMAESEEKLKIPHNTKKKKVIHGPVI